MRIPFSKVKCDGNEKKYVAEVIRSGWLTTASKCQQFESNFRDAVGAKYACSVNSATSALHLAVDALGIGLGDKVFVPTMTFTASAEIVRYVGADPILLDVDYGTSMVTPDILENGIAKNPEAKAIILVHFGGQAADLKRIIPICNKNKIKIIEDAAHAFPTKFCNKMIGSFGNITCFSFYANKPITTGEGGMLVTDDENVYRRAKTMRLHGISRDVWDRFTNTNSNWEYDIVAPGYKYNLADISAAIGLAQLERAEMFRRERQRCTEIYLHELSQHRFIDVPKISDPLENHSHHLFWIVLKDDCGISRNDLIRYLSDKGIGTSVHYKPLHRMTYYKERYNLKNHHYPNAEKLWSGNISLPLYPSLSDKQILFIVRNIKSKLKGN